MSSSLPFSRINVRPVVKPSLSLAESNVLSEHIEYILGVDDGRAGLASGQTSNAIFASANDKNRSYEEEGSTVMIPRPYQLEAYLRALYDDVGIILPTGSGKSLVAAMLLHRIGHLQNSSGCPVSPSPPLSPRSPRGISLPPPLRRIGVFVTENSASVQSHCQLFKKYWCVSNNASVLRMDVHTSTRMACGSGDVLTQLIEACDPASNESHTKSIILVTTSEALLSQLDKKGGLSWGMIHTLVLDDFHRWSEVDNAVTSYDLLMKRFNSFFAHAPRSEAPRLLGLTSDAATTDHIVLPVFFPNSFPRIDCAALITNSSRNAQSILVSKVFEDVGFVPPSFSKAQQKVHKLLSEQLDRVVAGLTSDEGEVRQSVVVENCRLGKISKGIASVTNALSPYPLAVDLAHCMLVNETLGARVAHFAYPHLFGPITSRRTVKSSLGDDSNSPVSFVVREIEQRIMNTRVSTRRAGRGIGTLGSGSRNDDDDILCLLFVDVQVSAEHLSRYLQNELPSCYSGFTFDVFLGSLRAPAQPRQDSGGIAAPSAASPPRARVRILISTTVAEQGVDTTGCDFVARLTGPKLDLWTFTQVKRRAKPGQRVMFFVSSPEVQVLESQIIQARELELRFPRTSLAYENASPADYQFEDDLATALQTEASRQAAAEHEKVMHDLIAAERATNFKSLADFTNYLDAYLSGVSSFEVRAVIQSHLDNGTIPMHHLEAIAEVFIEEQQRRSSSSSSSRLRWPQTTLSLSLDPCVTSGAYKKWFREQVLGLSPPMTFDWDDDAGDDHRALRCVVMCGRDEGGRTDPSSTRTVWHTPRQERTTRLLRILKGLRQRWLYVSFDLDGKQCELTDAQGVHFAQAVRADEAPLRKIFLEGFTVFGVRFEVLCASTSQLRSACPTVIFIEATANAVMTPTQCRQYLFPYPESSDGSVPTTRSQVFTRVSRFGLYCANDVVWCPLPHSEVAIISDVYGRGCSIRGDRGPLLTDGCGFMKRQLAKELFRGRNPVPSLVQFRYDGMKGVLLVVDDGRFTQILASSSPNPLLPISGRADYKVMVRPSQIKFTNSPSDDFCVIKTSAEAGAFTLNREIINLILSLKAWSSSLSVPKNAAVKDTPSDREENPQEAFEHYVLEQLERIQQATVDSALGGPETAHGLCALSAPTLCTEWDSRAMFALAANSSHRNIYNEPFIQKLLAASMSKLWSDFRNHFRIPFGQGCRLLGCADPFGVLKDGEIFAQIQVVEDSRDSTLYYLSGSMEADELLAMGVGLEKLKCISSEKVLVCRNPCPHPGDVQICRAVDLTEYDGRYDDYLNVVFFPCNAKATTYSVPHRCSGGDLDGDEFSISWDSKFTSNMRQHPHFSYDETDGVTSAAVVNYGNEAAAVAECLATCVDNSAVLGSISNMHASACEFFPARACDPRCISLVKAISLATDFPKKGVVPEISTVVKEVVREAGYPIYIRGNRAVLQAQSLLTTIFTKCNMPFLITHLRNRAGSISSGGIHVSQRSPTEAQWIRVLEEGLDFTSYTTPRPLLLEHCSRLWNALMFAAGRLRGIMIDCDLECEAELFVGTSRGALKASSFIGRASRVERVSGVLKGLRESVALSSPERRMPAVLLGLFVYVCSHYPVASYALLTRVFENEVTTFVGPVVPPPPKNAAQLETKVAGQSERSQCRASPTVAVANPWSRCTNNKEKAESSPSSGFSCLAWSSGVSADFFELWSALGVEGLFASFAGTLDTTQTASNANVDELAEMILGALNESGSNGNNGREGGPQGIPSPSAAIFSKIESHLKTPTVSPTARVRAREHSLVRATRTLGLTLSDWRDFLKSERNGLVVAIRVVLDWACSSVTELQSLVNDESRPQNELFLSLLKFIGKMVLANKSKDVETRRRFAFKLIAHKGRVMVGRNDGAEMRCSMAPFTCGVSTPAHLFAHRYWSLQISMLIAPLLCLLSPSSSSYGRKKVISRDAAWLSQLRLLQSDDPFILLHGLRRTKNFCLGTKRAIVPNHKMRSFSLAEMVSRCVKAQREQSGEPSIMANGRHDGGAHFFFPSPLWKGLRSASDEQAFACIATAASKISKSGHHRLALHRNPVQPPPSASTTQPPASPLNNNVQRSVYIASITSVLWSAMRSNFDQGRAVLPDAPLLCSESDTRRWKISCRFGKEIVLGGLDEKGEGWSMRTLTSLASNREATKTVDAHRRRARSITLRKKETMVPIVARARSLSPPKAASFSVKNHIKAHEPNEPPQDGFRDRFETMGPVPSIEARHSFDPCHDITRFIESATSSGWLPPTGPSSSSHVKFNSSSDWVVCLSLNLQNGNTLCLEIDKNKKLVGAYHQDRSHGKLLLLAPSYCDFSAPSHGPAPRRDYRGEVLAPRGADVRLNFRTQIRQTPDEALLHAQDTTIDDLGVAFETMGIAPGSVLDVFDDESWSAIIKGVTNSCLCGDEQEGFVFFEALPPATSYLCLKASVPSKFAAAVSLIRVSTGWMTYTNPQDFPQTSLRMTRRSLHYKYLAERGQQSSPVGATQCPRYLLSKTIPFEMDLSVSGVIDPLCGWQHIAGSVERGMRHSLAAAVSIQELLMEAV